MPQVEYFLQVELMDVYFTPEKRAIFDQAGWLIWNEICGDILTLTKHFCVLKL